jgi:hypothetical protein
MRDIADQYGFEESVLNSYDDYEPYGYDAPRLAHAEAIPSAQCTRSARDRVIEAELLSHCTMVGC